MQTVTKRYVAAYITNLKNVITKRFDVKKSTLKLKIVYKFREKSSKSNNIMQRNQLFVIFL